MSSQKVKNWIAVAIYFIVCLCVSAVLGLNMFVVTAVVIAILIGLLAAIVLVNYRSG